MQKKQYITDVEPSPRVIITGRGKECISALCHKFTILTSTPNSYHRLLSSALNNSKRMKIAVEGCCHGELDAIYRHVQQLEERHTYKIDLLLICGDFQAVRNYQDLQCMAVPDKYKRIQDFHKYYTGERTAPLLTIIIGGNHEASNYMSELYHGGWLAPNIYFLGCAGSVLVNGMRITGASGIFNTRHFSLGHYEKLPYDSDAMRSVYHIREYNVRRLSLLPSTRIFLSHDWPQSIERYGDLNDLLRRKTFLRGDVAKGTLGSPPLMGLLRTLRPEWWFSAHLHTRYQASVFHDPPSFNASVARNPDEVVIDDDEFSTDAGHIEAGDTNEIKPINEEADTLATKPQHATKTTFLALDKCLPKRHFLEVIDVEAPKEQQFSDKVSLTFDPEWLAITRALFPWFSTSKIQRPFPEEADARALVAKEQEWVTRNIKTNQDGEIPVVEHQRFAMTAPGPGNEGANRHKQPPWYNNPQTEAFCRMLNISNLIDSSFSNNGGRKKDI